VSAEPQAAGGIQHGDAFGAAMAKVG